MKTLDHLYELPCYPDLAPSDGRRVIVNIHDNFCGRGGSTVFIGGGGVKQFATHKEARNAVGLLVLRYLEARVESAKRQYEYAQRQLDQWDKAPELFRARIPL